MSTLPEPFRIVENTREGWASFRHADRTEAAREAVHFCLEIPLALALAYRLLFHMLLYGAVCEYRGDDPQLSNEVMHYNNIFAASITAGDRRAEQVQRLGTAFYGAQFYLHNTFMPTEWYEWWLIAITAGYLMLDPLLGAAWFYYED